MSRMQPAMSLNPHFRILMCTLNGAAYLPNQLNSFLRQDHGNWSLWVSDDGSRDATRDILEAFRRANPSRDIRLFDGPGQGVAANYLSLMQQCQPEPAVLVALSDQDDVWLPEKLARAAATIAAEPDGGQGSQPVIYAAAQIIADAELENHRQSRVVRSGPSFGNALVQNILSGNSLVLNPSALALVQRTLPPDGVQFHDWWIYQLITGAGGHVICDPEPALIYRQHRTNTLGGNRDRGALHRRASIVWNREFSNWVSRNIAGLQSAGDALMPGNRALLQRFAAGSGRSGVRRAWQLYSMGIRRQSPAGTLAILLAAFLGRI